MKRANGGQFPPIKRATPEATTVLLPPALPQLNPSTLRKMPATDEEMSMWTPLTRRFLDWEDNVLTVLAEDYSSFDAEVINLSSVNDDLGIYAMSISFKGKCPLHGYRHHSNHWCLINTRGYATTLFLCHHDRSRRVIQAKFPFPPSILDQVDWNVAWMRHQASPINPDDPDDLRNGPPGAARGPPASGK